MAEVKDNCEIFLKNSMFNESEAEDMWKKLEKLPSAFDGKRMSDRELKQRIAELASNRIDKTIKELHDRSVIYNQAKEATSGAKTIRQALKNWYQMTVGRAGADAIRRVYNNRLMIKLGEYTRMFGVPEGKDITSIKKGSAEANQLFTYVYDLDIRSQIPDVAKLTPLQARAVSKGKTDIEKLGLAIATYNEYSRRFLNASGLAVKYNKNYVIKLRYDYHKIKSEFGNANNFSAEIVKRLDRERSIEDPRLRTDKYITKMAKTLWADLNKAEIARNNMFGFSGPTAANAKTKKFVWKSAEDAYQIFNKVSAGDFATQFNQLAFGMSSTAVKINKFGYDHKTVTKAIEDRIKEKRKLVLGSLTEADTKLNVYHKQRLEQAIADFTGDNTYTAGGLSTFGALAKMSIATRFLGNSIKVAMLDPADTGRQAFYVSGGSQMEAWVQWNKHFYTSLGSRFNNVKKENMQMVAEHLGVLLQYHTSDASMRMARGELYSPSVNKWITGAEKAGNTLMRISTLLPQQTVKSKLSSGIVGAQIFTDIVDKVKFKDGKITGLNKYELDTLKEYKISARELAVIAETDRIETWAGAKLISGKNIRDYILQADPSVMVRKLGVLDIEVGTAALELADKYDMYVNDFFSRGTPTPELSTKVSLLKGSGSEVSNFALGLFTQFKDTPMMQLISYNELLDKMKRLEGVEGKAILGKEGHKVLKAIGKEALAQTVPHVLAAASAYVVYDTVWSFVTGQESLISKWEKGNSTVRNNIWLDILGRVSVVPFAFEIVNGSRSQYYGKGAISSLLGSPATDFALSAEKAFNPNQPYKLETLLKRQAPNAWWWNFPKNKKSILRRPFED
jgi:hypothetical protein